MVSRTLLIALALLAAPLGAQTRTPVDDPVPARDTFSVVSRALGETRLVNLHTPATYRASPAARFAVLYMPDGGLDEDFPHVVHTVDSLVALRVIRPVIIVGIPNTERRRDLTGPTRVASDSAIAKRVGGSAAFRRFIRDELMPAVRARYRTATERSIVGESLAGLFVVETFSRRAGVVRSLRRRRPERVVERRCARGLGGSAPNVDGHAAALALPDELESGH